MVQMYLYSFRVQLNKDKFTRETFDYFEELFDVINASNSVTQEMTENEFNRFRSKLGQDGIILYAINRVPCVKPEIIK